MKEVWRAIRGYERSYEVSNLERVRSRPRTVPFAHRNWEPYNCTLTVNGRILKQHVRNNRPCVYLYEREGLSGPRKRKERSVRELMRLAFVREGPAR